MKYRVVKEFGCTKIGDVLSNSTENPHLFTLECTEEDTKYNKYSYRFISIDEGTALNYKESGYLVEVDEENSTDNTVNRTVKFIDNLLKQYSDDLNKAAKQLEDGTIRPCVKLETDTVLCNLIKVLNKVKEELLKDE